MINEWFDGHCTVVSYSATNVSCSCPIRSHAEQRQRRLIINEEDGYGSSELVAMTTSVALGFVQTFTAAPTFTSLAALRKVLIIAFMFAGLWGGGLVFMIGVSWYRDLTLVRKRFEKTKTEEIVLILLAWKRVKTTC